MYMYYVLLILLFNYRMPLRLMRKALASDQTTLPPLVSSLTNLLSPDMTQTATVTLMMTVGCKLHVHVHVAKAWNDIHVHVHV